MKDIRIAAISCEAIVGEIDRNLITTIAWSRKAKAAGADLVCFPELNITGYCNRSEMAEIAQPIPGPVSQKLSQLSKDEQIVVLANWVKVRDASGKMFWIEKRHLSSKRFVIVTVPLATVRRSPEENAQGVFKATKKLGLKWLGNTDNGWVKVRHIDGSTGYLKSGDVWGD